MLVYVTGISTWIKSEIKLLHNENKKVKADAGEKDKIDLFILKVNFLKTENNNFKNETNSKRFKDVLNPRLKNYVENAIVTIRVCVMTVFLLDQIRIWHLRRYFLKCQSIECSAFYHTDSL